MRQFLGRGFVSVLVLAGFGSVSLAAEQADVMGAQARLAADFPSVQQHVEGGRVTRLYGQPFGFGASAVDSAEDFRLSYAEALGAAAGELVPGGPLWDGRHAQQLMYDPGTGKYKFTLVYYTQHRDGIPVFRADLRLLVLNRVDHPLVLAASALRDLGDFVPAIGVAALRHDLAQEAAWQVVPDLVSFSDLETVIWAGVNGRRDEPTLALTFIADNFGAEDADLPERMLFVVDAVSGELLYQESLIIFEDVSGNVSGMVTEGQMLRISERTTIGPAPSIVPART